LRDGKSAPAQTNRPSTTARASSQPKKSDGPIAPKTVVAETSSDVDEIWHRLAGKIPPTKKFLKSLIDSTHAIGAEGRTFLIGYPPEQKSMIETLATDNNRRFLESLLKEISGKDWNVKFTQKEGLTIAPPTNVPNETVTRPDDSFRNDPVIQEALEIFKGEIKN
jgi:hypothetical protein